MVVEIVKTIQSSDKSREVEIFRRDDGTFGFYAMKWSRVEQSWLEFGRFSECYVNSQEAAESEARGRIGWLPNLESPD